MKTTGIIFPLLLCILTGVLFITGCSDVADDFHMPPAADIKVHEPGFDDPESDAFHGNFLRENDWDWTGAWPGCEQCHGVAPAFEGGITRISCATSGCHIDRQGRPKSVASCNTCHGDFHASATDIASFAPPRDMQKNTETTAVGVGAHQVHLRGDLISAGIECSECHIVPSGVFVDDHLTPKGPEERINFGDLASLETKLIDMGMNPPVYNPDAVSPTCQNTYCHGNFSGGNPDFTPVWTVVDGSQSQCGTCHGDADNPIPKMFPEGPHPPVPDIGCQICHWLDPGQPIARRLEDGTFVIENKELHIDGAIYITGEKRTDW